MNTTVIALFCVMWFMPREFIPDPVSPLTPLPLVIERPITIPEQAEFLREHGYRAQGLYVPYPDGILYGGLIIGLTWDIVVHEMCHHVQHKLGLPMSEPACVAVQAVAYQCLTDRSYEDIPLFDWWMDARRRERPGLSSLRDPLYDSLSEHIPQEHFDAYYRSIGLPP